MKIKSNKNITAKERGLIKGSIRRVFSRSDARRGALAITVIPGHTDSTRPRVKKWSICPECSKHTPTYKMEVDHKVPIVPLDKKLEDMSWDGVVNRIWCEPDNLRAICKECHLVKTKKERKERTLYHGKRK